MGVTQILKPALHKKELLQQRIDPACKALRLPMFAEIFIGYARQILLDYVLVNKLIWCLIINNAFIFLAPYVSELLHSRHCICDIKKINKIIYKHTII